MLGITREHLKAEYCSRKADSCQEKQNHDKKNACNEMLDITKEHLKAESCSRKAESFQDKSFP